MDNFTQTSTDLALSPDLDSSSPQNLDFSSKIKPDSTLQDENLINAKYEELMAGQNSQNAIRAEYEKILEAHGEVAANGWLNRQLTAKSFEIQAENHAIIAQVQQQYQEIYSVPEVKLAIDAYLQYDLDPSRSLKEQGFSEAIGYISSIYKAGFENAMAMKSQNSAAKSRMDSSITNFNRPSLDGARVFSRAEIAGMSPEVFAQNEKFIFEQMSKGLIK